MSELAFENLGVARVSSIKEEKHLKTSKDEPGYYWHGSARDYYTKQKGLLEVELLN